MGRIIAVANQKGGVGKTTTAVNLAASLAALEAKTLVIDIDPQANTTSGFGVEVQQEQPGIYECMLQGLDPKKVILPTSVDYLDMLPATINLVGAEVELVDLQDREEKMKQLLSLVKNDYDYIIIDCAPSLGLLTVNALTASNSVIIPVQCEYFALEGLGKLLNTIRIIQSRLNPTLEIEGILLTMYDARLRLSNQIVEEIRNHFQHMAFQTVVPRNVRLSEAPSFGKPVLLHDATSKGALSYLNLAKEIIEKNCTLNQS